MQEDRRLDYFVLAGTSGTGKTTMLNRLRAIGFDYVEEAARSVLSEQLAIQGPGLPSKNPLLFVQMMMDQSIQGFEKSKQNEGLTFFDRGMPDLVHYAIRFGVDAEDFEAASKKYLYNKNVFIFPPWRDVFVNDNERKMTFEKSVEFHELLLKTYQRLNYNLIEVPIGPFENRLKFILENVR